MRLQTLISVTGLLSATVEAAPRLTDLKLREKPTATKQPISRETAPIVEPRIPQPNHGPENSHDRDAHNSTADAATFLRKGAKLPVVPSSEQSNGYPMPANYPLPGPYSLPVDPSSPSDCPTASVVISITTVDVTSYVTPTDTASNPYGDDDMTKVWSSMTGTLSYNMTPSHVATGSSSSISTEPCDETTNESTISTLTRSKHSTLSSYTMTTPTSEPCDDDASSTGSSSTHLTTKKSSSSPYATLLRSSTKTSTWTPATSPGTTGPTHGNGTYTTLTTPSSSHTKPVGDRSSTSCSTDKVSGTPSSTGPGGRDMTTTSWSTGSIYVVTPVSSNPNEGDMTSTRRSTDPGTNSTPVSSEPNETDTTSTSCSTDTVPMPTPTIRSTTSGNSSTTPSSFSTRTKPRVTPSLSLSYNGGMSTTRRSIYTTPNVPSSSKLTTPTVPLTNSTSSFPTTTPYGTRNGSQGSKFTTSTTPSTNPASSVPTTTPCETPIASSRSKVTTSTTPLTTMSSHTLITSRTVSVTPFLTNSTIASTTTPCTTTASTTCVIDTSMTPVTRSTMPVTPTQPAPATKTICDHDHETGAPKKDTTYCGVSGKPVAKYFIAEFDEDRSGEPVTEEGCYQFCDSDMDSAKGCQSYRFYHDAGVPRCALYGTPVSMALKELEDGGSDKWHDLACGSPSAESWHEDMPAGHQ